MCKFSTIIYSLSEQNSFHKIDKSIYSFDDWNPDYMGSDDGRLWWCHHQLDESQNTAKLSLNWKHYICMRDTVWQFSYSMPSALPLHHWRLLFLVTSFTVNCDSEKYGCQRGVIHKMSALRNKNFMTSNEQENNKLLRNLPIQEILQEKRSQNKQEQIRERVLDTCCRRRRRPFPRPLFVREWDMTTSERVINCSDRPSATRWVKASGDLLALRDRNFGGDFSGALLWQDVL